MTLAGAFAQAVPRAGERVRFRAAEAADAAACAPLVFASGVAEFGFFLGESDARCIAFLQQAFRSRHGRFSWRRHRVAVADDGTVLGVLAIHDGQQTMFDDLHVVWALSRFFGVRRTIGQLLRGLILETEIPAPKRSQILVAHCATDERQRGTGVFSALFRDALDTGVLPADGDRDVVLDVLTRNVRARALYERLGFVALPRRRTRSRRLPGELESVRMRFAGRG
ncbi:GNAT family N-acetyltransferase [Burkholderia cenocepacia]|uniref:Acetyltransferase protein n=1 Tax=Burkholderia cenocepacia (strain ATCC BAA-245 / DSM 16553 / LMG 16656 / NCTC 13227 / J2315 / CF5610) TaxID=216591 RepID=B4EDD6_BURCJ|nr:GNAT family N-acetyltransferase [Burkholderia cenocepacia]KIS49156.1 acetyltransferase family protein [Burkholderia cepacia]EPZ85376.1 acetyltransferase, GNAT family [Burkholderia cenocepacia K56-2Valvano]ERI26741.1 acetyltransferase, GNAT family [Burkholderia cenocepacia BC7]KKI84187.1 acetyltransferase [Burkholderia cenocepacia]ONR56833.1 N-acetyltransferase [Burkholderia cenocepacia]